MFGLAWLRAALLVATTASCLSCYPKPTLTPVTPTAEPLANYSIGEVKTASPGSVMIERVEDILTLPGFVLSQELPLEGARPPLPGGLWPARILYGGPCGGTYVLTNPSFYNEVLGIVVDENGAISCQKPVVQIRGSKTGRTFATKLAVGSTVFTPKTYFAGETPDSLRWQLLYSGRAGNEIVLDYREFTEMGYGSTARPAFYQQVKYDLSTGRTITFKETQIEVLDATNSMISFRVLRDEKKARRVPDLWEAPTDGALAR